MSKELARLISSEKENRTKEGILEGELKKVFALQDEYHTLSLKFKRQIDNVYLCWTGKEATKYINASNNDLEHNKERFDFVIETQKNRIYKEHDKLEREYETIKKNISIVNKKEDGDKENKNENKCSGN